MDSYPNFKRKMKKCYTCANPARFYEEASANLFCGKACQLVNAEFSGVDLPPEMVERIMMEMGLVDLMKFIRASSMAKDIFETGNFKRRWVKVHDLEEIQNDLLAASEGELRIVFESDFTFTKLSVGDSLVRYFLFKSIVEQDDATFANYILSFERTPASTIENFLLTLNNTGRDFDQDIRLESLTLTIPRDFPAVETLGKKLSVRTLRALYLTSLTSRDDVRLDCILILFPAIFQKLKSEIFQIITFAELKESMEYFGKFASHEKQWRLWQRGNSGNAIALRVYIQSSSWIVMDDIFRPWATLYSLLETDEDKSVLISDFKAEFSRRDMEYLLFRDVHAFKFFRMAYNITLQDILNGLGSRNNINLEAVTMLFPLVKKMPQSVYWEVLKAIALCWMSYEDRYVLIQKMLYLRPIENWGTFKDWLKPAAATRRRPYVSLMGTSPFDRMWRVFEKFDPRSDFKKFLNLDSAL